MNLKIIQNDHIAFEVSNLKKSLRFYQEVLELKLLFQNVDYENQETYAFLEINGGNLELLQQLNNELFEKPKIKPPYCPHLALGVDDISRVLQLVYERNIPIVKGPLEIKGQVRWLYIHDPDNNIIEFVQWLTT